MAMLVYRSVNRAVNTQKLEGNWKMMTSRIPCSADTVIPMTDPWDWYMKPDMCHKNQLNVSKYT